MGAPSSIRAAAASIVGADRVDEAGRVYAPRVPCGDVHDPQWRLRYTRMLRLLETRFRLQAEGES